MEPLRGATEMTPLGDRDEVAQEPQIELIDRWNLPIREQSVLDLRPRTTETGGPSDASS